MICAVSASIDASSDESRASLKPLNHCDSIISHCADELRHERGRPEPVATGFPAIDEHLGGLQPKDLIVLASRSNVEKNSLAVQLALNSANAGTRVVYFSLEYSAKHLTQRFVSSLARIPLEDIRAEDAGLSEEQLKAVRDAAEKLKGLDITVDDTPGISIQEMRDRAKGAIGSRPNALCIVDYLQLVQPPIAFEPEQEDFSERMKRNVRAAEIEQVVFGLKNMAEKLQVPVLALSALSMAVELRRCTRPKVTDIRNPSIVLGADVLLLLDCSLDEHEAKDPWRPRPGEADLIVAKNEHGTCRDHRPFFDAKCMAFEEKREPNAVSPGEEQSNDQE